MGCYFEILERTKQQLDVMLLYHSRIMVVRVDLHLHDYSDDNLLLSKFIRKIRRRLREKYGLKRLGFVWVREREKAKKQHYHLAVMLDANKVNYPGGVLQVVDNVWKGWAQPKPYTPENCYYIIHRGFFSEYQNAFFRLSYMAKERGKGCKSKTANDYSTSRIRLT